MITLRLFMIGLLCYANYVASERRCAFIRPIPPKKNPFDVDIKANPDTVKLGLTKNATLRCSGAPGNVQVLKIMKIYLVVSFNIFSTRGVLKVRSLKTIAIAT